MFGLNEETVTRSLKFYMDISDFRGRAATRGRLGSQVWLLKGLNWVRGTSVQVLFTDPAPDLAGFGTVTEVQGPKYLIVASANALGQFRDVLEGLQEGSIERAILDITVSFSEESGGCVESMSLTPWDSGSLTCEERPSYSQALAPSGEQGREPSREGLGKLVS